MSEYVRKVVDLLTPQERRKALLVLAMVVAMAFVDTAGIASVMPFLAVLGNPAIVETNLVLASVYDWLGFNDLRAFLLFLGAGSFFALLACSVLRLSTIYALRHFTNLRRHSVSERLLARYLRQPYEFFLGRNTADLSKAILSEVDELAANVFMPAIQLVAYGATVVVILLFLVLFDPGMALAIGGIIGGVYLLCYLVVKGILLRIGRDRARVNRARFVTASEALGGIKDIKVFGREDTYLRRFRSASVQYSRYQTLNAVLALLPKYVVEAVGIGVIIGLAMMLTSTGAEMGEILPVLGLYAVAGHRLLPSAQQIFACLTQLRYGLGALEVVHRDLRGGDGGESRSDPHAVPYRIREEIRFHSVTYTYPGAARAALEGIDFVVPRNTSLGIVGETGAGKSTVLDLLLGLLTPSSGAVLADGTPIRDIGIERWRRTIGYVPQQIYLADCSIAENIALGSSPETLDLTKVEAAARAAQIHEFVASLPQGYSTVVGERGVRLSGGQRQRIGIARALYHDPDVLVLDEATNALDPQTEAQVMASIGALQGQKTLIIVTHRWSTVEHCDQIVVLRDGRMEHLERARRPKPARTDLRGIVAG